MIFLGLQGSFDWAVQAPNSVGAKLTNASPGIVFATVGMFIGVFVILQRPVNYSTGTSDLIDIAGIRASAAGISATASPMMIGDYSRDEPDDYHRGTMAVGPPAKPPRRRAPRDSS